MLNCAQEHRRSAVPPQQRSVGKIDDYDPMNGQWGSAAGSQQKYVPQQQQSPAQQMPGKQRCGNV